MRHSQPLELIWQQLGAISAKEALVKVVKQDRVLIDVPYCAVWFANVVEGEAVAALHGLGGVGPSWPRFLEVCLGGRLVERVILLAKGGRRACYVVVLCAAAADSSGGGD